MVSLMPREIGAADCHDKQAAAGIGHGMAPRAMAWEALGMAWAWHVATLHGVSMHGKRLGKLWRGMAWHGTCHHMASSWRTYFAGMASHCSEMRPSSCKAPE